MATCERRTETIVRTTDVILTLTEAEANTLSQLLAKVGGRDSQTGHRDRLSLIGYSLRNAGFNSNFELPAIGFGYIFPVENEVTHKIVEV